MKTRLAVLCIALVAAVALPQSFEVISAEQLGVALRFDHLPALNATPHGELLEPATPFPKISSRVLIGSNNTWCRFNLTTFTTSDPVQLFSSPFLGAANLDGALITGSGNENILLLGGPAGPSNNPLSAFLLGPPFERLGPVMQVPGASEFGHQVVMGNFTGDDTLEVAVATNRGGPGRIEVFEPQTGRFWSFFPMGESYSDGVQVTAADINGDRHDELIVYQTRGREFFAFEVRDLSSDPILVGFGDPFGPSFFGGGSVTGFDVNHDGRDELIFAPGPGPAPLIRIIDFDPVAPRLVTQFMAGPETMTGGTTVQAGLTDGQLTIGAVVRSKDEGSTSVKTERYMQFLLRNLAPVSMFNVYDGNPFAGSRPGTETALALLFITGEFGQ